MSNRCKRCGRVIESKFGLFGPECAKKAEAELIAWSTKVLGETPAEFIAGCCEDWGSDDDITGAEYIEKHGIDVNDINMWMDYMTGHMPLNGTIWHGTGRNIRVIMRSV